MTRIQWDDSLDMRMWTADFLRGYFFFCGCKQSSRSKRVCLRCQMHSHIIFINRHRNVSNYYTRSYNTCHTLGCSHHLGTLGPLDQKVMTNCLEIAAKVCWLSLRMTRHWTVKSVLQISSMHNLQEFAHKSCAFIDFVQSFCIFCGILVNCCRMDVNHVWVSSLSYTHCAQPQANMPAPMLCGDLEDRTERRVLS